MKIAIGAGHSPNCDGSSAYGYSENHEARLICDAFERICADNGVACVRCDSSAGSKTAYLNEQVAKFNHAACDYSLQIHLNAAGGTGCEVWRMSAPYGVASAISAAMANTLGLRDRGVKYSDGLRILNSVWYRPYIVEVCFIDRWSDIQALQGKHEAVAAAIFEAVTGITPKKEDDMNITVQAPAAARVGDAVVYRAIPECKFNYAWAYGDDWEDWGSTMKGDKPATSATEGSFMPTKPGKYRLWIDCIMPDGTSYTTAPQTIIVTDEAILNATVEAQE